MGRWKRRLGRLEGGQVKDLEKGTRSERGGAIAGMGGGLEMEQLQVLGACLSRLTACSFFLAALANSDRSRLWIRREMGMGKKEEAKYERWPGPCQ